MKQTAKSAAQSEERRRLARLSDQWADRAVKAGCRGRWNLALRCALVADLIVGASWSPASSADRLAAEARAV